MSESLDVLTRALQRFATESLSHGYEVLMEADACAWLFHLLLPSDPCLRAATERGRLGSCA